MILWILWSIGADRRMVEWLVYFGPLVQRGAWLFEYGAEEFASSNPGLARKKTLSVSPAVMGTFYEKAGYLTHI